MDAGGRESDINDLGRFFELDKGIKQLTECFLNY